MAVLSCPQAGSGSHKGSDGIWKGKELSRAAGVAEADQVRYGRSSPGMCLLRRMERGFGVGTSRLVLSDALPASAHCGSDDD